jgi:hypothetical protein
MHRNTAVAAKVVEAFFIEKHSLNRILDAEEKAERLKVLQELWPETINSSEEDLHQLSEVVEDGEKVPIHSLFSVEVFKSRHKFYERGQKMPWDLAHITLIIEGQVELQSGMITELVERGTVLGKEMLTGDNYADTAQVKSEKVRVMQIRVQDYAVQYESQHAIINQLRGEAWKHLEDNKTQRKSIFREYLEKMKAQAESPDSEPCALRRRSDASEQVRRLPLSGIELKTFRIEDLARETKAEADRKVVLGMHPHASFKKLPPRRMPPIDRPSVCGRALTVYCDQPEDLVEKPTTRRLVLARTAALGRKKKKKKREEDESPPKVPSSANADASALRKHSPERKAVCTRVVIDGPPFEFAFVADDVDAQPRAEAPV